MPQGSILGYNLHLTRWIETIIKMKTQKHKTKEPGTSEHERCYTIVGSLTAWTAPHISLSLLRQNSLALSHSWEILLFIEQGICRYYLCMTIVTNALREEVTHSQLIS